MNEPYPFLWSLATPPSISKVPLPRPIDGIPRRKRAEQAISPDVVYQIGVPPQRIDILASISGLHFDDAWAGRLTVDLDGLSVSVIGLRHLHANKLATGRAKDQQDAASLEDMIGKTL